jgi:hypothetical protein
MTQLAEHVPKSDGAGREAKIGKLQLRDTIGDALFRRVGRAADTGQIALDSRSG